MAVRKRDVRPTDANVVKQSSTALTCVTAATVEIFVRTLSYSPSEDLEEDEDVAETLK